MAEPQIGATVGGCELIEIVGRGGMGVIYKARQKSLDRVVALKILAPRLANDINFVGRFQKEARSIARVNHPNILAVYDVGMDQDVHYMIMELIEGESLAELQTRLGGPLRLEDASQYARDAALGLEAAHATGITHRDVKPENLMLTRKGVIKVSDFGLAKEQDSSTTSTDAVMGTPAFMSPEQCDGKRVDARTDIYSLGGSFYKQLTGRLPFEAETAMSMMYRHKHEALVPPREIVTSIPKPVSDVVVKMMAKKPEQRFQSMTEVVAAIEAALRPEAHSHAPVPPAASVRSLAAMPPPPAGPPPPTELPPPARPGTKRYDNTMAPPPGMSGRLPKMSPARRGSEMIPRSELAGASGPPSSARMAPAFAQPDADDAYSHAARGDDQLSRGDRGQALKSYRQALAMQGLDNATRQRIEKEIGNEVATRRTAAENLIRRGLLVEASRELRVITDLDPRDEPAKAQLKDIESKLAAKRTLINDIRTAIGAQQFGKAIEMWDRTPLDLRDESLAKQIEHLRNIILPSIKLCDQGEAYNDSGRLEEALSTFQDALRIDETCERARQGVSSVQSKLQRIDGLLKEGYELNLQQDYIKAIDMWRPILGIRPGHPQATKSIVDAYMAIAQDRRAQGDIRGALKCYTGAKEVDPKNRTVSRLYDELQDMNDKEQALMDRANDASTRSNRSEAIRYLNEAIKLNPSNKSAREKVAQLSKQRSRGALVLILVASVLLLGAVCGYQYFSEYQAMGEVKRLYEAGEYEEALIRLKSTFFFFKSKKAVEELERACQIASYVKKADDAEKAGQLGQAIEWYKKDLEIETATDAIAKVDLKIRELISTMAIADGKEFMKKFHWKEARDEFLKVKDQVSSASTRSGALVALADQANKLVTYIEKVQLALTAEKAGNIEEGIRYWQQAADQVPEETFAKEQLKRLNHDPQLAKDKMGKAIKLLKEPWNPESLKLAVALLDEAALADRISPRIKVLKNYARDMNLCANDGMVLWNDQDAEKEDMLWSGGERKEAFCIDRYEYPNAVGAVPNTSSWMDAHDACMRQGKDLCTPANWRKACLGKSKRRIDWTIGPDLKGHENDCNWRGGKAVKSGENARCYSAIGAYDMSGNVAEWVQESGDNASIMGGDFEGGPDKATCSSGEGDPIPKSTVSPKIGWRCCKALPEK